MNGDMKNICGPHIKRIRTEKGWTQKQLAQQMKTYGVELSESSIRRIENQTRQVFDVEFQAFVKVLEISYEILWGISGDEEDR